MTDVPRDRYTHGHHQSVVQNHARRRAEGEAWFLLPHLKAGMRLLDVGCGPGTITAGLARAVAPGEAVGIDLSEEILTQARDYAAGEGVGNVRFTFGDVYQLDYEDGVFDVVYANQVLQHLTDQPLALREMRRVLKPGGILSVRETDYATMCPSPKFPEFEDWSRLYHQVAYRNGAEPDAGRNLARWVREAGFSGYEIHPNVVVMDGDEARFWGNMWSQRILHSNVGTDALAYGLAEQADLDRISAAWTRFAASEWPFYMYAQLGVLARKQGEGE